jgi:hypothetical protein
MKPFIPGLKDQHNTPIYVCLGEKDTQVAPQEVRKYLSEQTGNHNNTKIMMASWLAHGIDLKTFRTITSWFLSEQDD